MKNAVNAANLYLSLAHAERRALRLEDKLNKAVANLTPEEMAKYAQITLEHDAKMNARNKN